MPLKIKMCIVLPFLCSSVQHFIQCDKENAIWHQIFASPSESRDYDIPTAKRECRHECLKKPNWGTSGRKQWRSQLTHCPSNLSLLAQKPSLILAIKRQCYAIIIVYMDLCKKSKLFAIWHWVFHCHFKSKSSHLQTNSYTETPKQLWLVSFSFIKSPGNWPIV